MAKEPHTTPNAAHDAQTIRIHWYQPTLMVSLLVIGILFSLGHHFYYASLHSNIVEDQAWVIRVGTVFAFLVKASILGGFSIAIKQVVWLFVRRKAMSISGLDAIFSITWDPTAFFVQEMWTKALTVSLLGLLLWTVPLAVVVTPATIAVVSMTDVASHSCDIPILNFSKRFDWEYTSPQSSLANFNLSQDVVPVFPDGDVDAWTGHVAKEKGYGGPTPFAEKLFRKVLIGSEILNVPSVCGPNCSYTLTTPGVGYNCTLLSAASRGAALVNSTELQRRYAWVYVGVLQATRSLVGVANCQETVNYQLVHSMDYFACFPWEVTYELNVNYKENIQDIRLKQQTFVRPIMWPQFPDTGLLSTSYPETNYWAYQALADLVGQHFKGGNLDST